MSHSIRRLCLVIIGCRSAGSGEATIANLHSSDPASIITFREGLELSDMDTVFHWADKIKRELERDKERVNLLVCNAGIMHHPFELTKDGFETHMQGTSVEIADARAQIKFYSAMTVLIYTIQ